MGHEPTALRARAVWIAVAVLLGGIVVSLALMGGLSLYLGSSRGGEPRVRAPGTLVAPPAGVPAVDANQIGTLRELQAREDRVLSEYAWVDRQEGVARIPVRRAMEILAQEPAPTPELPDDDTAAR